MPHLNLGYFGIDLRSSIRQYQEMMARVAAEEAARIAAAAPAPAPEPEPPPPILEPVPTIDPLILSPEGGPTSAPEPAAAPAPAPAPKPVAPAAPPNRLLDIPLISLTPAKKYVLGNAWWWKFLLYLKEDQFKHLLKHIISGNYRGMYGYLKDILHSLPIPHSGVWVKIPGWYELKGPHFYEIPQTFARDMLDRRKIWGVSKLQHALDVNRSLMNQGPMESRDLALIEEVVGGGDIRYRSTIRDYFGVLDKVRAVSYGQSEKVFVPGEDHSYWHIEKNPNAKWRDVRNYFQNIPLARAVLNKYPFPTPSNLILGFWIGRHGNSFRKFLNSEKLHTESDIRTAVTLSLMEDMGKVASEIEAYQKEQAKKAKRNKLIEGLMIATLGAILGPAIGAVAASGWGTAMKLVDLKKAKAAAVSLDKAARQYAETDLAFSQELERVAMEIDADIVAQEREEALNQAEIDALAQEEAAYHIFVEGVEVATADSPEEAAEEATKKSETGQRVEVFHQLSGHPPTSTGLGIRTSVGIERVPPGIEDQVRAMTSEQVRASVEEAESKRELKAPFPWAIVAGAAAAAALIL